MRNRPLLNGFTLIELLTVIAVIGLLGAIIIPVFGNIKNSFHRSVCASNLRQLASASQLFSNENQGDLIASPFTTGEYWFRQIYPFIDNPDDNKTTSLFQCPADAKAVDAFQKEDRTEWETISYLLLKREANWTKRSHIDRPSSEPQFIDAITTATNNYRNPTAFESAVKGGNPEWRHGNGVNVAYWDGSVQFITNPTFENVFVNE